MRVLIADDSGVMRKIMCRCFYALGVEDLVEAADGREAIDKFAAEHFDMVVTDWNMPESSGLDVVKSVRAAGSSVPVIMVTTESEKHRVLEAIQAGVSDYLVKPFDADCLRDKLGKFVCV